MSVHILHTPGHNVVIQSHSSESDGVMSALKGNGFRCGTAKDVVGIPQLVAFNVARVEYGSQIESDELRALFKSKGFDVAE